MSGPGKWDEHTWDDLISPASPATPDDVRDALLRDMGEDVPPSQRRPRPGPDTSALRREIGLD